MTGLRTIEQIRARALDVHTRPERRPKILDPNAGECAPLFTSRRFDDCLTHLTRYIAAYPDRTSAIGHPWPAYDSGTGWCGVGITARQIELADATGFCCAKCLERAAEVGQPTYNLVPDTGCAVSAGKRGRNRARRETR